MPSQRDIDQARHVLVSRRRRAAAARRETERVAIDEATRQANAKAGEALEAGDLEGLSAAKLLSGVEAGFLSHLPTPQLKREDLKDLSPDEINRARRVGMLDDLLAGKPKP